MSKNFLPPDDPSSWATFPPEDDPVVLTPEKLARVEKKAQTLNRLTTIKSLDGESPLAFNEVKSFSTSSRFSFFNLPEYRILRKGTSILGGEASSGKTTLALQVALDIMIQNPDVHLLFYSLDESLERAKRKIFSLLLANQDLLPTDKTRKRYNLAFEPLNSELQTILLEPKQQQILQRINICDDPYFLDPNNEGFINAYAHVGSQRQIIIVDYLQLLPRSAQSHHNLRENFNATLAYLKAQVNKINSDPRNELLLILLSQVSRSNQQSLFNFRETSEIENIADTALVLEYASQAKGQQTGRGKERVISQARTLRLVKNKDGAKATFEAIMSSDIPFFHHIDLANQRYSENAATFRVTTR